MSTQQLFLVIENNHDQGETVTWRAVFKDKLTAYEAIVKEAKDLEELYGAERNEDADTHTVALFRDCEVVIDWEIVDAELVG